MPRNCLPKNELKIWKRRAESDPEAKAFLKKYEENAKEVKEVQGFSKDKMLRAFIRNYVDVSGNVKRDLIKAAGDAGRRVVLKFQAIAGGNARARFQYEEAWGGIYKGLNSQQVQALDMLIQARSVKAVQERIPKQQVKALQQLVIEKVGKLNRAFDRIKGDNVKTREKIDNEETQVTALERTVDAALKNGDIRIKQFQKALKFAKNKLANTKNKAVRQEKKMAGLRKSIQSAVFNGKTLVGDLKKAGSIAALKPRARGDKTLINGLRKRRPDVENPFTPEQTKAIISFTSPELNALADKYQKVMRSQLQQLLDAGLLTQEGFDAMKDGDYSKRNFVQHLDPSQTFDVGGRQITVTDSGVKALAEGSDRALQSDSQVLMAQVITRTQSRIARNEANTALFNLAKSGSSVNGIVMISKEIKPFKKTRKQKLGAKKFQGVPSGYTPLSVLIESKSKDGKKIIKREQMIMKNEQAREWVSRDPAIDSQLANMIGWVSGAKLLRATATGLNPGFAVTNIFRDMAHMLFVTREFSPVLPIGIFQLSRQMLKVLPDVARRRGRYKDFIREGGGMDFLTDQGSVFAKFATGKLHGIKKVGEYVGLTSELMTRIALREQAIQNGASPFEATQLSRGYLDFNQGGRVIKALDSGIPYLNAAIQGTRGLFRSAGEDPAVFAFKMAQLGGASMLLFAANVLTNDEAYDSIGDEEKAANFIITTPSYSIDKDGNKRYFYIRIAKDQGQRFVSQLFEGAMAKIMGREVNADALAQAAKDFLPLSPDQALPPTLSAMLGYMTNTDFWRGDRIWNPRFPAPIRPEAEFLPWTHPAFVATGEATKDIPFLPSSPERLRFVVNQFFVNNNPFLDVVGFSLRQLMDELPDAKERELIEKLNFDLPIVRRLFRVTKPFNVRERKEAKKVEREVNTRRAFENKEFAAILNRFDVSNNKDEVREFIANKDRVDRGKFKRRLKKRIQINRLGPIKERRFWMDLLLENPESRVINYQNKFRSLKDDPEAQAELERTSRRIPGFNTRSFRIRLAKLRSQERIVLEGK